LAEEQEDRCGNHGNVRPPSQLVIFVIFCERHYVFIREIQAPCDPIAIGRRLLHAGSGAGLVVLRADARGALRQDDARFSFVAAEPIAISHDLVPQDESVRRGAQGWGGFGAGPRWVGVVPYEALRGLERRGWTRAPDVRGPVLFARPIWNRYSAVIRVDHETGTVAIEADDPESASRLERALRARAPTDAAATFALRLLPPDEPELAHVARVRLVLDLIARGDVYQVNMSRRIPVAIQGDTLALFASLVRAAPAPYGFFAELGGATVCAASPELALEVDGELLRTAPIKGTRPRGADTRADEALANDLARDPKENAELTMAIDVHRNDLGRVALNGSVRVLGSPQVAGAAVWSRVAEIVARRDPRVSLETVARAMLPCGSVTGAPKVRAMEVIANLEPCRRGLYTGAFGYIGRGGRMVLAMAIRTLTVDRARVGSDRAGFYHSGGGIVADSDPQRELEETGWKAAQLRSLTSRKVGRIVTRGLPEEGRP
jgi:anthranilate/para-aminobenzoate synthase component I